MDLKSRTAVSLSIISRRTTLCTLPPDKCQLLNVLCKRGLTVNPINLSIIALAIAESAILLSSDAGFSIASLISFFVIELKVIRFSWDFGIFKSSFKCQPIASPSLSGSVAIQIVLFFARAFSFFTTDNFSSEIINSGSKLFATSIPSPLPSFVFFFFNSLKCPIQDSTRKCSGTYFCIDATLFLDSTINKSVFDILNYIDFIFD